MSQSGDAFDRTMRNAQQSIRQMLSLNAPEKVQQMSDSAKKSIEDLLYKVNDLRNLKTNDNQFVDEDSIKLAEEAWNIADNTPFNSPDWERNYSDAIALTDEAAKKNSKYQRDLYNIQKQMSDLQSGTVMDQNSIDNVQTKIDALKGVEEGSEVYAERFREVVSASNQAMKLNAPEKIQKAYDDTAASADELLSKIRALENNKTNDNSFADIDSMKRVRWAAKKLEENPIGTDGFDEWFGKAQARYEEAVKANSKYQRELYNMRQKASEIESGTILDSSSIDRYKEAVEALNGLEEGSDVYVERFRNLQTTFGQMVRNNDLESIQRARTEVSDMADQLAVLKQKGSLGDNDLVNFSNLKSQFDQATAGTKEFEQALIGAREEYDKLMQSDKIKSADATRETRILREQEHRANIKRQASELLQNSPRSWNTGYAADLQTIIRQADEGKVGSAALQQALAQTRQEMDSLGMTSESLGERLRRLFHDHFNTAIAMAGLHLLQGSL